MTAKELSARSDFAFYGKNYGWATRYRRGGKSLLSIYPGKESFTAQIVLAETEVEKASSASLGASTKRIIEQTRSFPEGRWLFITVGTEKDLEDVKKLVLVKSQRG